MARAANTGGGWGYYAAKSSRVEPTCWGLLTLDDHDSGVSAHAQFLARCQQSSGWLTEDPQLPVNVAFNALAAFTWFARTDLANADQRQRLLSALIASKGVQAPASDSFRQNNSLQGWSWIAETFSWMEPTAWGLLALKKAQRAGVTSQAAQARIDEADRLLIDRACAPGGWNFGNANAMHQDLRPYVPTTALGLLALQDRPREPVVERSLAFLEAHCEDEVSATALGLSMICLAVHGRSTQKIEGRLRSQVERTQTFGNLHALGIALFALTMGDGVNVFRL